ncbi:Sentrin-specific protease [Hypsibius exemplaris]|uniref:Sentrin-specific protease n=1 Tax=Hypsibius exemplaris TaxID=2072580 RepID=A0A1W0WYQ2_HYPEX|nr:Sentrin-specific protease [Hypsibius exemplaris]
MAPFFASLKRTWTDLCDGVKDIFTPGTSSTATADRGVTRNGSANGHCNWQEDRFSSRSDFRISQDQIFDPYNFDTENHTSPLKRPKLNGGFWGEQRSGPLGGAFTRPHEKPTSRKPTFTDYPAMKMADGSRKQNGKQQQQQAFVVSDAARTAAARAREDIHRRPAGPLPPGPRGRSEASRTFHSTSIGMNWDSDMSYNRRLVGLTNDGDSGAYPLTRRNLPSNSTFSSVVGNGVHTRGHSFPDRRNTENYLGGEENIPLSRSSAAPGFVSREPVPRPPVRRSNAPLPVPSFDTFQKQKQPATAVERYDSQKALQRRRRTENPFEAPSSTVHDSWKASPFVAFTATRIPSGVTAEPVDSSYSARLRQNIAGVDRSRVQPNGSVARKPPVRPATPEVITISDSDDEDTAAPVGNQKPHAAVSPTDLRSGRIRQSPVEKTTVIKSGVNGYVSPTGHLEEYQQFKDDPNYVPKERQDDILRRMKDVMKHFQPTDLDYIPLNADEDQEVDKALGPGKPEDVLSDAFKITIRRKDMLTLKGLAWLNDEVANFFLEMIVERSSRIAALPKVYSFNTFFYPQLMNKGFQSLKRWTRKVDIFGFDMIIVPVHMHSHWCLAVISLKEKNIKYYDSLGHDNLQCFALLRGYLEEESKDKKKTDFRLDWEEWNFVSVANEECLPQQRNMCDCGVFMLKFADFISRGKALTFSQDNMPYFRRRIVVEILKQKLIAE